LLDLFNSNLLPQLLEQKTPKRLGEDVPALSSSLDILELDASSIDTISDEVKDGVDVLDANVEDRTSLPKKRQTCCPPVEPARGAYL
jgi:hypothetical protein